MYFIPSWDCKCVFPLLAIGLRRNRMKIAIFKAKASTLAQVMANKGVKVTISGSQAYSSGDHINLPEGDFTDSKWRQMLHGWIDHELGHQKHTNDNVYKKAIAQSDFLANMLNVIEDVRMEKLVGENFRGAKINLNQLAKLAIEKELFASPAKLSNVTSLVQALCLYRGRAKVIGQICLDQYSAEAIQLTKTEIGAELVDDIVTLVDSIENAKSTQCSFNIATAIIELLKEAIDSSSCKVVIQGILDSSLSEGLEDFHEKLAGAISTDASEHDNASAGSSHNGLVLRTSIRQGGTLDVPSANYIAGGVYQALNKVFFDQQSTLNVHKSRGTRIDSRRLCGISTGRVDVFKNKNQQTDVSAAISVVIDASGSMSTGRMKIANTAALAFAKAFQRCGIESEFSYFSAETLDDRNSASFCPVKRFNEKSIKPDMFSAHANDGTPTGDAMEYALLSMSTRPENNKILFVITDGDANAPQKVRTMKDVAKQTGVTVIPIGIGCSSVRGFDDDEFVTINDTPELVNALKRAIKLKLFK